MKKLINFLIPCALSLSAHVNTANADLALDAEAIFNWAEQSFPQYFPSHQSTQSLTPWLFRRYETVSGDIYAGVNVEDAGVYVLGGAFGSAPLHVDNAEHLLAMIGQSQDNAACDIASAPAGISYQQNGDTVTVTTNGQCIELPSTPLCTPKVNEPQETGIHILTSTQTASFSMQGISVAIPGVPNPLDMVGQSMANNKSCVIHAPSVSTQTVNYDVCYDITNQLDSAQLQSIQDVITITPPITIATSGTFVDEVVSDCFSTDASSVVNLVTREIWVKQNGAFVKVE